MTRSGTKASRTRKNEDTPQPNTQAGVSSSQTADPDGSDPIEECGDKKIRWKSLVVDGIKYRTHHNKKFENRVKWTNPDQCKVFSVIPGTVLKILTSEGEKVSTGDNMIILEAMKMKNKIVFSRDGIVKKISVKEGEKIPKGYLMVELED